MDSALKSAFRLGEWLNVRTERIGSGNSLSYSRGCVVCGAKLLPHALTTEGTPVWKREYILSYLVLFPVM